MSEALSHEQLTPQTPAAKVIELLRQPPGNWPAGWSHFHNVVKAFQALFHYTAARHIPPPPAMPADRGIVICGGDWRFFPSIYVSASVIRKLGCKLPIQVWHLGGAEYHHKMGLATEHLGVEWVDANRLWAELPGMKIRRNSIDHGWMLKPFAVAFSPFKQVLSLDADCYPVYNPEAFIGRPEVQRVGAAFWLDPGDLRREQVYPFGLGERDDLPALESGQFFVDKSRHWAPLWLACFLNAYHDFTWRHVYGDKDTFILAWTKLNREFLVSPRPSFHCVAMLQHDYDGRVTFVHRIGDKFKWAGTYAGKQISAAYQSGQCGPTNAFICELPHEQFCHQACLESSQVCRSEQHFEFRPRSDDQAVWEACTLADQYQVPDLTGQIVVDVGAHIGGFSWQALRRGAKLVVAAEPDQSNVAKLRANLKGYGKRVEIHANLVWRSDREETRVMVGPLDLWHKHHQSIAGVLGKSVPAIKFDRLIGLAASRESGRVNLVKLNCDVSLYPILYTSQTLGLIDKLCGVAVDCRKLPPLAKLSGDYSTDRPGLVRFLTDHGFNVTLGQDQLSGRSGRFWAWRS